MGVNSELLTYPPREMSGFSRKGRGGRFGPWSRESHSRLRWRSDGEAQGETRTREKRCRLVESLTERVHRERAVRGTERTKGYPQLGVGNLEVSGGTEELMQQGASFLLNACIVRLEKGQQVALGLESKHLDNVGEVLAFGESWPCSIARLRVM